MPISSEQHEALGLSQPTPIEVNGRSNRDALAGLNHPDDQQYTPCPEALQADVPRGNYLKFEDWQEDRFYPGVERTLSVYLPSGATEVENLPVIIFNDGAAYASTQGPVRATHVIDSLQFSGAIKPTVAVFVNPGKPNQPFESSMALAYNELENQRSQEYDEMSPHYGAFLLASVLPWVAEQTGISLTTNPAERTVCGIFSGGIAAFSCAWFHPEAFQRVISHCGSFTNIRGGHNYPYMVQTTPRKPIRVFMQSGAQDITTLFGHWPSANTAMARALEFAGYDMRFEFGQGGHTLRHGGALFADTLRWLWR